MIVERRPLSSNKSPNRKFTTALQELARQRFQGEVPLTGSLYARIIWFYDGGTSRTTMDVDNIAKWILDSLKGIVYIDDQFILKCATEKVDKTDLFTLSRDRMSSSDYDQLAVLLGCSDIHHILYIEVGQLRSRIIHFGPIDGEVV
jgi:hypothetical protein